MKLRSVPSSLGEAKSDHVVDDVVELAIVLIASKLMASRCNKRLVVMIPELLELEDPLEEAPEDEVVEPPEEAPEDEVVEPDELGEQTLLKHTNPDEQSGSVQQLPVTQELLQTI